MPVSVETRFNLVIERLLISGQVPLVTRKTEDVCFSFNLVIERLLISGGMSTNSCLSFRTSFNLVIERLLISGKSGGVSLPTCNLVSISLSSGFSFQERGAIVADAPLFAFQSRYRAASHFRSNRRRRHRLERPHVSISLSSGFSFQVRPRGALDTLWLNARTSASLHFLREDAC